MSEGTIQITGEFIDFHPELFTRVMGLFSNRKIVVDELRNTVKVSGDCMYFEDKYSDYMLIYDREEDSVLLIPVGFDWSELQNLFLADPRHLLEV